MELRDSFTLGWCEAAIKGLALVRHVDEELRRFEPVAVSLGEVITDVREADVGSILGFGFAPFSGGTISYIDGMGVKNFVQMCNDLAKACGERFKPSKLLIDMANKGETFYGRFAPAKRKAVA